MQASFCAGLRVSHVTLALCSSEVVNVPHKFIHCDFGNGRVNADGRGPYSEYFYDWLTRDLDNPVSMTAIDASQGKNHAMSADELRKYRVVVLNIWRGILDYGEPLT